VRDFFARVLVAGHTPDFAVDRRRKRPLIHEQRPHVRLAVASQAVVVFLGPRRIGPKKEPAEEDPRTNPINAIVPFQSLDVFIPHLSLRDILSQEERNA
jgi:hypothetical protein